MTRARLAAEKDMLDANRRMKAQLAALFAALGVACAAPAPGPVRLGSDTSFDGLIEVANAKASKAWIRPDFDLSGYTRVKIVEAGIEYRPVPRTKRSQPGGGAPFPMTDSAKQQLRRIMTNAFQEELAESERFELTEETGPDVLLVWGGLLDVVSFVPPQTSGRSDVGIRRIGEATLVIELRDSESEATLARILDRRAAQKTSGRVVNSNPANTAAETRRLANSWAKLLRQRLENAPTLVAGKVIEPPSAE